MINSLIIRYLVRRLGLGKIMSKKLGTPKLRRWKESDLDQLVKCHKEIYSDYPEHEHYGKRIFKLQLERFPVILLR